MSPSVYPDDPAGPFAPPPRSFSDGEGHTVWIRELGGGDAADPADGRDPGDAIEALVSMYRAFDPDDRAQGIPPTGEAAIREWLDAIVGEDRLNVVARHESAPVGHGTLVPDGTGAYELAIFVLSRYQNAGIGTELIEALLGLGGQRGVDRVWLTVERWNAPARRLYRKVGFEPAGQDGFELEMSARLQPDASGDASSDPAGGDG